MLHLMYFVIPRIMSNHGAMVERNRTVNKIRRLAGLAVIGAMGACGGGGALVDPQENPPAASPASPAAPPSAPPSAPPGSSNIVVTTPGTSFSPSSITVPAGAMVTWRISGATHNVTFGAAKPTGGDIANTDNATVTRTFPVAGTFDYQCTRHSGMTGRVSVGGTSTPPGEPPANLGTTVLVSASGFSPERAEITPGSTITWEFTSADGIVFEDAAPPEGNIPETPAGSRVSRTFPAAGDYDYRSLRNDDIEGRIRVR